MKVLHISSFDLVGGAARAAYRLHSGLQAFGVDSQMLVQFKAGNNQAVMTPEGKVTARLRSLLDGLPLKLYKERQQLFSPQWFPSIITSKIAQIKPDIINLNWICNGFLPVETLAKLNKPLVWTLLDMWAFTGGCHYSLGCDHYQKSCGSCPQLKSQRDFDLSRWVWQRKAAAWKDLNLTIVAPSSWMAKCASTSPLFSSLQVKVIPIGLDTNIFKPVEQTVARELLGLPQEKKLVLFGAINATGDSRKGFHFLQAALKHLKQSGWGDRIEVAVFGASAPEKPTDLSFNAHYLGHLQDDLTLRVAYAAADVMVAPSIEEAFGQTATESLACGTPVVAFNNTGFADTIDHQKNGYLAKHSNAEDLASGIAWVMENPKRHQILCQFAREKAEKEFPLAVQAHRYLSLFDEILS